MPNWVTNYLTVDKEVADKILNKENKVDFEILIPMPENVRNTVAPYDENNWYDWSIEHWGCKWNASDCSGNYYLEELEELEIKKIRIMFDTPWSVPMRWLEKLAELKIDFHLAWYEEQGYRGIIKAKNGIIEEFELPEVKWTEDENGNYYSSEEEKAFDWRDIQYEGQFEELNNTENLD